MGKEKIGYRRLYDSRGCSLVDRDEVWFTFQALDCYVDVYMGPKPQFGIWEVNSDKYIVPEEFPANLLKIAFQLDATKSTYPRSFFSEITCWKIVDVSDEISEAFHEEQQEGHTALLQLAQAELDFFKARSDFYCGLIGLRFHPQFLQEMLNENCVAIRPGKNPAHDFAGPGLRRLETPRLLPNGAIVLSDVLSAAGQAPLHAQNLAFLAFHWLLRGWREEETISKFTALFTAIEIILGGVKTPLDADTEQKIERIRSLITALPKSESPNDLEKFFDGLLANRRPSLTARFAQLATEAGMEGAQADILAFKHFNSVRNRLLHRGSQKVELSANISETEIRQLGDISERYVNWVFFNDTHVYKSVFRHTRRHE